MLSRTWNAFALFFVVSCSQVEVPPPPGLDAWQDRGTSDRSDEAPMDSVVEGIVDPGPKEVGPDVIRCSNDEECIPLVPPDDPGCRRARCDPVLGCVLENLPAGDPCGKAFRVPTEMVCTTEQCDGYGRCVAVPLEDGTPCDLGVMTEPCVEYRCRGGECEATGGCDDDNPCTQDSCVVETGTCQHGPVTGGACDDEDPCTIEDACFAGICLGKPNLCEDGNPCTDDRCAKGTGCVHPPIHGKACDDGNACTRDDVCLEGLCRPGAYVVCNDGNRCTADQCNPTTGECEFTPTISVCDDGDPCTDPDQCQNGKCVGVPKDCDDHDPCTADSCQPGTGCVHPVIPGCKPCAIDPDCHDGNPCTKDLCVGGDCKYEALNGIPCHDGNACTISDVCENGRCTPGIPKDCGDDNLCTDDSCDPSNGQCEYTFNARPCEDGNPCTRKDQCFQGSCVGTPATCDDGNECTDDSCDPADGQCVFTYNNKECDDGEFCTVKDKCSQGSCTGTPVTCNDNNPCTKDYCDETNKRCVNEPIVGCLNCTVDKDCNDGNACTQEKCVASKCEFTLLTGTACEDGNKCTQKDTCQNGQCQPGAPLICAPKMCHGAVCIPATGCVYTPLTGGTCDDGDPCTGPDQCVAGSCVAGPLLCCEKKPDGTPCSDQDDSTGPDYCIAETCRGFVVVPFQAATETGLNAVDAAAGIVTTGWFREKDAQQPTGFVATATFGKPPKVISSTRVPGKQYRSISSWLAVGDGGLVAYRTAWGSTWVVGGVLGDALNGTKPFPGNLTDVFGRLGPDPGPICLCCRADSYVLVGRDLDDSKAWARHCTIYQQLELVGACSTKVKCGGNSLQGVDPAFVWPMAVTGVPSKECPGACLSEASIAARVTSPLGILQVGALMGSNSGDYIQSFALLKTLPTSSDQPRDLVRLKDVQLGDIYFAVGGGGLILVIQPTSGEVSLLDVLNGQKSYDFTGVAVSEAAGYLLLSGLRRLEKGGSDMVIVVHPLSASVRQFGSYYPLSLRSCDPKLEDCSGFALEDVTVAGNEVTAVGTASWDKTLAGIIFYLKM